MQQEKKDFLTLAIPPARLNITETAWFLGFTDHDISVLISVGLLKPLGHPPPSGSKYFATAELQSLRNDTQRDAESPGVKHRAGPSAIRLDAATPLARFLRHATRWPRP